MIVDTAVLYSVANHLGNVISGSYGSKESLTPANVLIDENLIDQVAAVLGISANYSSSDYGDFAVFGFPATVSAPADSSYATAIGGVKSDEQLHSSSLTSPVG